jgi:AcrR family transcriptional regulator
MESTEPLLARPVRRRQPEVSRRRLLDAAANLIARRGFHDTTIDAVADAAGISRGAIFWHFGTKDDLLNAVIDDVYGGWIESARGIVGDRRGLDAVRVFVEWRRGLLEGQSEMTRLMYVLVAEAMTGRAAAADTLLELHARTTALVTAWLDQASADGELVDVDPGTLSEIIIGSMQGIAQWRLLDPTGIQVEQTHEALLRLISRP